MKNFLLVTFLIACTMIFCGCTSSDKRVNVAVGVKSDNAVNNILTRPFYGAYSLLAGEGIDIKDVKTWRNNAGFMELQVSGHNRAVYTKQFEYRVEWVNDKGVRIDAKQNVWLRISAKAMSDFSFTATAPSKDAVDFKINTRKAKG
jgi:predicted phosphoadenosine phosphosulfate sulfurtransferase